MDKQIEGHLSFILGNLCRYVKVDYWDVDFSKDNWYQDYKWSQQAQDQFAKWLSEYFYGIRGAQKELYGRSYMRKKECEEAAKWFIFQYGWSLNMEAIESGTI